MRSLFSRTQTCVYAGLLLLAGCCSPGLFAQSAAVNGQVLDPSGAGIKGASVTLVRPSTQVTVTAVTDANGVFILPPAAPGEYEATISATGFTTWKETGITIEVGQQKVINATLKVGANTETVSVTDTAPELQTESSDRGTVAESALVANIPLDVRNPFQETNFTPGVVQSNSLT